MLTIALTVAVQVAGWEAGPPLPRPVSNNAVAAVETSRGWEVYALLGLDSSKRWDGVVNWAFRWNLREDRWEDIEPVPGPGRLAGTAQAVRGKVYLFGGYTVAQDGSEQSLPNVDIYDPLTGRWSSGTPIPVPTDDASSGVWRDSLIFLVSGWHDRDNIANVQIYDPARDAWQQATPIPGPPVFGHAGTIVGDAIVYIDGVRVDRDPRRFVLQKSSWQGEIDPLDPTRIAWRRVTDHPRGPLYRAGAGTLVGSAIFAGGTDNPYNYDGIGYDGIRSEPLTSVFTYDPGAGHWSAAAPLPQGVMDLRGIVRAGDRLVIVGGMRDGQRVGTGVWVRRLGRP